MRILYIAKRGANNIAAKTHLKVIKELYGKDNLKQQQDYRFDIN